MRIIGGTHRGRTIQAPVGTATRPMTDRAREALFNILGDISGLAVLDAYAGSGALGLEALSRGARQVIGIESARPAAAAIRRNVAALSLEDRYHLVEQPLERWLPTAAADRFDLIMADPPYQQTDLQVLDELARRLTEAGLLVLKHSRRVAAPEFSQLQLLKHRSYADNALSVYGRAGGRL